MSARAEATTRLVPDSPLGLLRGGRTTLLWVGMFASACNAAATLALIYLIKVLLNDDTALPYAGLWFLGLIVIILASHVSSGAVLARFGSDGMARLRQRLADAVTASDYQHIEAIGTHRIMAAFTEDLPRIAMAYGVFPTVLLNVVVVLCGIAFLGTISVEHLLVVLGLLAVSLVISEGVLMRALRRATARVRTSTDVMYRQIQALILGTKELKLNRAREAHFRQELFGRSVEEMRVLTRKRDELSSAYYGWSASISLLLIGGALWSAHAWLAIDRSQLVGFALVLLYLRGPVISIVSNSPHLAATSIALRNIRALGLRTAESVAPAARAPAPADTWREIVLDDVGYVYGGAGEARGFELSGVSFSIHRGELLFITGGNGSGKSTLAKILVGLYLPTQGALRIAGQAVEARNLAEYRKQFTAIFGDYYLFDRVLGPDGQPVDDEAVGLRLKEMQIDHKVSTAGGVFSTLNLSQGQRKRLAMVSALAENRPVMLFDEWAAEQDPEFRRRFYREFLPGLRAAGKTCIVITHDDQYFDAADRVLRMDQGRVQLVTGSRPARAAVPLSSVS
jgi:putative pyoverdin transport system ATP-binding/permease protein